MTEAERLRRLASRWDADAKGARTVAERKVYRRCARWLRQEVERIEKRPSAFLAESR